MEHYLLPLFGASSPTLIYEVGIAVTFLARYHSLASTTWLLAVLTVPLPPLQSVSLKPSSNSPLLSMSTGIHQLADVSTYHVRPLQPHQGTHSQEAQFMNISLFHSQTMVHCVAAKQFADRWRCNVFVIRINRTSCHCFTCFPGTSSSRPSANSFSLSNSFPVPYNISLHRSLSPPTAFLTFLSSFALVCSQKRISVSNWCASSPEPSSSSTCSGSPLWYYCSHPPPRLPII